MILSGPEIFVARKRGELVIEPYSNEQLNPNSYNFRLGEKLIEVFQDRTATEHVIDAGGLLLEPNKLYLGCTKEIIGSTTYVTTLLGRSSIGRLGLFLNITADLGHCGSISQWTLEMTVIQPLRIYQGMKIGQVAFWVQQGSIIGYDGRYHSDRGPQVNRDLALLGAER